MAGNKRDLILSLVCEAQSPSLSHEQVESALSRIREAFQSSFCAFSSDTANTHAGLVEELYEQTLDALAIPWALTSATVSYDKTVHVASLCLFIKETVMHFASLSVLSTSLKCMLVFLASDSKPAVLKPSIALMTTLYPLMLKFLWSGLAESSTSKGQALCATLERAESLASSHALHAGNEGVRNAAIKWVHAMILCLSYSAPTEDGGLQSDFGLGMLPADHAFISAPASLKKGKEMMDFFLGLCRSDLMQVQHASSGNLMAILNLLSTLLKLRPHFIPQVLPVLLDLFDNPPRQFSENQTKSIFHTLKLQLTNLAKQASALASASEFAPMIRQLLSEMALGPKGRPAKEAPATLAEPAGAATKRAKLTKSELPAGERSICRPSIILSSRKVPFDIAKIPLPWLIDIVVGSLMSTAQADIEEAISTLSGEASNFAADSRCRAATIAGAGRDAPPTAAVEEEDPHGVPSASAGAVPNLEAILASSPDTYSVEENCRLASAVLDGLLMRSEALVASDASQSLFWMNLITRLVSLIEFREANVAPIDMDTKVKAESGASPDVLLQDANDESKEGWILALVAKMPPLTRALLQHVLALTASEAAQRGYDLGLLWLHYEWHRSRLLPEAGRSVQLYDLLSSIFCEAFSRAAATTTGLGSFLALAPVFTESAIRDQLLAFASAPEAAAQLSEAQLVSLLTIAKDLLLFRPKVRALLLPLLLQCLVSPVALLRQSAISVCQTGLWRGPLAAASFVGIMTEFAIHYLLELQKMASGHRAAEPTPETSQEPEQEPAMADDTARCLDLYFALCQLQPSLLVHLFSVYASVPSATQRSIRELLDPVIKSIYVQSTDVLFEQVFRRFPAGGEPLFLRMLAMVTKTTSIAPALIAIVKEVVEQRQLDARYLLPILHGLEKSEVGALLPKFLELLSGKAKEHALVREILTRIMSPLTKGALSPVEVLVAIHTLELRIGIKRAIEATQVCFSLPETFKQEVLAAALQQLVDKSPIPTIFMRTAIQALNMYRSLASFMTSLLFRLISKKIWTHHQLWEGFIRCCQIMQPGSLQILIQLPPAQLTHVLESHPEMKHPLRVYLQQQPPSLRHRFKSILPLLEM